ncbi:MAG: transketolase family protein [Candidatus Chisholmbacteria bacterium]|nr:transketolase family protein [Candidatus Chisholmbacteria bacterium]
MEKVAPRDGYGKGLVAAGRKNENVVVLCCDLTESTRSQWFKEAFPDRFIEVGVAEQNMAGMAVGMALSGKIPFCSSYAVFNPGRNWDQIRVSVCYTNANVKIAGAHAGISVGPDGATHQALEDIAITRVLPNMTVVVPCDSIEAEKATVALAVHDGPAYIRFGREKLPVITTKKTPFELGRAEVFREGKGVTIVACGAMVYEALIAAQEVDGEVINCHTIKPLDVEAMVASAKKTGRVVTAEEHQVNGGLGGAVAEALTDAGVAVPIKRVGMQDSFGESGDPEELLKKYKMKAENIVEAVRNFSVGRGILDLVGKMPKITIPKGKTVDDLIHEATGEIAVRRNVGKNIPGMKPGR